MSSINYRRELVENSVLELETAYNQLDAISKEIEIAGGRLASVKGMEYLDTGSIKEMIQNVSEKANTISTLIYMIKDKQDLIEKYNISEGNQENTFQLSIKDILNLTSPYKNQPKMFVYYYKDQSGNIFPCYLTDTARNPH